MAKPDSATPTTPIDPLLLDAINAAVASAVPLALVVKIDEINAAVEEKFEVLKASLDQSSLNPTILDAIKESVAYSVGLALGVKVDEINTEFNAKFEALKSSLSEGDFVPGVLLSQEPSIAKPGLSEVLSFVKRDVVVPPKEKGEEPFTKQVEIKPEEVLDYNDLGDRFVVVTTDGKKFYANKA